jgi:hypothetical protein
LRERGGGDKETDPVKSRKRERKSNDRENGRERENLLCQLKQQNNKQLERKSRNCQYHRHVQ